MLPPDVLAARATAVLVSRSHNASIYVLRGCEDLDARYHALERILAKGRLRDFSAKEPEKYYEDLLAKIGSDAHFARKLDALANGDFATKFGQLVTYALSRWDELPERQRELARESEAWIAEATASWPDHFREALHDELIYSARRLYLFTNVWMLRRMVRLLDPARLAETRDFPGMAFSAALDEEMDEIEKRRGVAPTTAVADRPRKRADQTDLAGLAFSGGGIRSATFNLGVLQFLGESRLLRRFDYLSTVSGGGYIGCWLHAWIRHADRSAGPEASGIGHVEECLSPSGVPDPQDERAAPIRFLRRYSNYLTPQTGPLSADTWTMLNIWLRNTFLNLLILTLALSAILLSPRWLASFANYLDDRRLTDYWWALLIPPACLIGLNLAAFHSALKRRWVPAWLHTEQAILLLIVTPIFLAAWGAGTWLPKDLIDQARIHNQETAALTQGSNYSPEQIQQFATQERDAIISAHSQESALVLAALVLLVAVTGRLDLSFYPILPRRFRWLWTGWAYVKILAVCSAAVVPSTAFAYFSLNLIVKPGFGVGTSPTIATLDMMKILTASAPAFLFLLSLAVFLYIGLLGRRFSDDRREWMARLGGWLTIACIGWVALCGTATYGPGLMNWLVSKTGEYVGSGGLGAVWILAAAAGVFAGRATNNKTGAAPAPIMGLIAAVAPPVFVAGLLLLLSHALERLGPADGWPAFELSALCGVLAWTLSWRVDINEFSLHQFYRNRLVRCYLGGARADARQPDPFTGFDGRDDFPVTALAPSRGYSGPYPIFNATLNVSHGDELAWQERKGENFIFTPKFSGFDVAHGRATHPRTAGEPKLSFGGYRPTADYAYPSQRGVSVGTAVAISGAAGSPNQGKQTSASAAFLLTVLDVRLGWWLGNPRRTDTWHQPGPTTGLFQLMAELTGSTSDTGGYVNLSDGGFFENLAVYELIRRRCRYIVACDSEEDHNYNFGGLGNLIRKCRTDFGVEIEIDTTNLKPVEDSRHTKEHFALGKIHYPPDAGGGPAEGTLIYIKSSLTGDESTDVMQYSLQSFQFPHESTADQWFDETQFESYRKLGYHAAESAMTGAAAETVRALFGEFGERAVVPAAPATLAAAG